MNGFVINTIPLLAGDFFWETGRKFSEKKILTRRDEVGIVTLLSPASGQGTGL